MMGTKAIDQELARLQAHQDVCPACGWMGQAVYCPKCETRIGPPPPTCRICQSASGVDEAGVCEQCRINAGRQYHDHVATHGTPDGAVMPDCLVCPKCGLPVGPLGRCECDGEAW